MNHKRILSAFMAILMMFSVLILPASALEAQSVTEAYVDDTGKEIAKPVKSSAVAKEAPDIGGYIYSSQSTQTVHVYSPNHITYIIGYPDGGVKVEQSMTRAEAATVLYRLYNGKLPAFSHRMSNSTFSDVSSANWFYKEIETLFNAGVIETTQDGRFRPNDAITRAEFATMCARYDGLDYVGKNKFSDVPLGHWAYSYIVAAAEKGWVKGYPDGTFRPDRAISRAEVMALVNRLFNRPVTLPQLPKNVNPYNDIAESHWAYCDAMEATIKHDTAAWHGMTYNGGKVNLIIEKYVDASGKEIKKAVTTEGKTNHHPAEMQGYTYVGYVTEITYVYQSGATKPSITKTASVRTASVGDTLTYTLKLSNDSTATDAWKNVVATDELPGHMHLVHGSIYLDGDHAEYSYEKGVLSVPVGTVGIGKTATITFDVVVSSTAYGQTITNKATGKGSNGGPVSDTDDGVTIRQGDIQPTMTKTPSVTNAIVGQTITYTINAGNGSAATYPWENAIITDNIPAGLSFVDGSVYLDGISKQYSYSDGILSISLGNIAPGRSHVITFKATVLESAYGKTIYNTAIGKGDNTSDTPAPDDGVKIQDGKTAPSATKTASVSTAKVGDTLTYTIKATNGASATEKWMNALFSDTLPEYLNFVYGSVQVNGETAQYSYKNGTLTVKLGDIAPGASVTVTFAATVQAGAYGKTIRNTAILSGDNTPEVEAPDQGVKVSDGSVEPYATKTANKSTASVGDTILYTVTIGNDRHATENWKNVVMTDQLSSYLTFTHGSVQLGGQSVAYSYNHGKLTVNVGNIAPNGKAVVSFEAVVNSTAYNQTIRNTAIMTGDNTTDPVEASDEGVAVGKGASEGTATKTANVTTAKTGDTITYTVNVHNSALATYPWENATITDAIPAYLTFVDGSVQIGGKATTNYSYGNGTLAIYLGDIAPGATVTATFRAKVNPDAQGQFIVNTAYVSGDNHATIPAPDKGVEIDTGEPIPSATKSANVKTAAVGDIITYTITAANSIKATADWLNVKISDVLPEGTTFCHGSIYINGKSADYTYANQAISINAGNIAPGESVTVKFNVMVQAAAAGKKIYNVAYITSANHDQLIVTDEGVTVPAETFGGDDENSVYGSKTADKISVKTGDLITYTIVAGNSNQNDFTWYDVHMYDILDTGLSKIIIDSVTIDGRKAVKSEYSFSAGQLVVKLGTLEPGQEATVTFKVRVTSEASGELISNTATLKGSNASGGTYNTAVRIKLETDIPAESEDENELSDIHRALFIGFEDGEWKPSEHLTRAQLAMIYFRMITKATVTSTKTVSDVSPDFWAYREIQYALSKNLLTLNGGAFRPDDKCTRADLGRLFNFIYGNDYGYNTSDYISRINAARAIVDNSSRHKGPITNGVSLPTFTDITTTYDYYWIVMEVSTDHDWYLDSAGKEYWDK